MSEKITLPSVGAYSADYFATPSPGDDKRNSKSVADKSAFHVWRDALH